MYTASDLRKGLKLEIDEAPYVITDFEFNKPGKGQPVYRCKMKNLLNGSTLSKSFRQNDKIPAPDLAHKSLTFSYSDGDRYVFMNEAYEETVLGEDLLGDKKYFLIEEIEVEILYYKGRAVDVTLPTFVQKVIIETEPGHRGNTATNVLKPATVEGGYEIHVPLFVNQGETVRIDTRTGEYVDRVRNA